MDEIIKCNNNQKISKQLIESLNFNQGGLGRHKCVVCAYNNGIKDGEKKALDFVFDNDIEICQHNRKALKSSIESIHTNQKPTQGRHKCAICAYHLGYEVGVGDRENDFDEFSYDELQDNSEIYDITTFGTSADVITIYNRLQKGRYYIPEFQRDYVWKIAQASRLIESIIMGLPIPAIFLAKDDNEENRYYIIDGQQRLTSIKNYYNGDFALKDTISSINGKKYEELESKFQERLDEYTLQLIMIRQETPDYNNDSIYKIFERINTEGTKLYPQEIRSASYHGELNIMLHKFAKDERWKKFVNSKNNRKKHEELILRFLALYFDLDNYISPIKHFLNIYMNKNRNLKLNSNDDISDIFNKTFQLVDKHLKKEHICLLGSNRINTQLLDSILVGIAHNLNNKNISNNSFLIEKIKELKEKIANDDFIEKEYWESRASKSENVKGRCNYLIKLFSE
jgi:hypothetical protein